MREFLDFFCEGIKEFSLKLLRDSQDYLEENPRILWDCCGNSEIFSEAIPGILCQGIPGFSMRESRNSLWNC